MNGVLPDVLRTNSAKSELDRLAAESRKRVTAPRPAGGFTTLPDGRVQDSTGQVIYTPTPREEKKK